MSIVEWKQQFIKVKNLAERLSTELKTQRTINEKLIRELNNEKAKNIELIKSLDEALTIAERLKERVYKKT
jgi:hypothetical protein